MTGFNPDDYVDVAQRIKEFYERFPEGRLTTLSPWTVEVGDRTFVCCHALAYRDPEDQYPGDGLAWEPVPGPTQFTKDSELMNAQTAAWGRAIVALGFDTKKIASRQEVQARNGSAGEGNSNDRSSAGNSPAGTATANQKKMIYALRKKLGYTQSSTDALSKSQASELITELKAAEEHLADAAAIGAHSDLDEIPF